MSFKLKELTVGDDKVKIPLFKIWKEMSAEFIIDIERLCDFSSATTEETIIISEFTAYDS